MIIKNNFTSVDDVADMRALLSEVALAKKYPVNEDPLRGKTVGLLFLNPSLRTRFSTIKAAQNLGAQTISVNMGQGGWALETSDGVVMDGGKPEHIKEAAGVLSSYLDVIAVRSFPELKDRDQDYADEFITQLKTYATVPVLSLESATLHPLQSLTDLFTINEHWAKSRKPKVVLTWAPHIKPLPQSVPNSFSEWMNKADVDFHITQPEGFELNEKFSREAKIEYDQQKALEDADFVYVKNWSSYKNYGQLGTGFDNWMLSQKSLEVAPAAKVMHCLPVRRNVVIADDVLDSNQSIVVQQAANRVPAAQAVLKQLLGG